MKAKRPEKLASASRHRNWQMLLYPESCAEDWKEFLNEIGVSWIASPLHDKDLNEDGTVKKEHFHLYVTYAAQVNYKQVNEDVAIPLGAVFPDLDNVVVIKDMKTAICYLTHDGFSDKAQYSQAFITKSPSFDIDRFTQITEDEQDKLLFEMIDFIEDSDITELCDLIYYCKIHNTDWFRIIKHKTIFFSHYITSRRNKQKEIAGAKATDQI